MPYLAANKEIVNFPGFKLFSVKHIGNIDDLW